MITSQDNFESIRNKCRILQQENGPEGLQQVFQYNTSFEPIY